VGTNVDVSPVAGNHWHGTIAVNPTAPTHLFAASNQASGGLYGAISSDSGATWTSVDMSKLDSDAADPRAAFDSRGNLFLTYSTSAGAVVVVSSINGGTTFTSLLATDPLGYQRPALAVGAGSVWVVADNPSGGISATGAAVTGLGTIGSFAAWQVVPQSAGGDFPSIVVGPSGQAMVAYQNPADGTAPSTIYTSLKSDGLGSMPFGTPTAATTTQVGTGRLLPAQPDVGIDAEPILGWDRSTGPYAGRVYLAYTDAPSSTSNNTSIYLRYSLNNGQTWTSALKVNDDSGTNSHFNPALAVDQATGKIGLTWLDARHDLDSPNVNVQTFATVSYNGGHTFVANQEVSDSGGNSSAAESGNPADFGHYLGLDFWNNNLYPLWPDNSPALTDNPDLPSLNLATAQVTAFPNVLSNEHVDLVFDYPSASWDLHIQDKDYGRFFAPDQVLLYAGPNAYRGAPSFLGVANAWILPQTQDPRLLYLGNNAEHTPVDVLDSYTETDSRVSGEGDARWIKVQVVDVRGPGAFFVWQTNSFGQPTMWVNTLQGVRPNDLFFTFPGGHIHYSWGFSAPGVYQVDLQSSAYLHYPDQPTRSAVTTFTFCVEAADNGDSGPAPPPAPPAPPAASLVPPWRGASGLVIPAFPATPVGQPATEAAARPGDLGPLDLFFAASGRNEGPAALPRRRNSPEGLASLEGSNDEMVVLAIG
jgi:surface-anchored protein